MPTGFQHPVSLTLGYPIAVTMASFFIFAELVNLAISLVAVSRREHQRLIPYVFTLPLYFPMAALFAYKALKELALEPFYWDKTEHGITSEAD